MNKKKLTISLITAVVYILLDASSSNAFALGTAVADGAIVLCSLLCGMPWAPLMALIASFACSILFSGIQPLFMIYGPIRAILIAVLPSLLSHFTGANLSDSGSANAGKTAVVVGISAVIHLLINRLYVWLIFAVHYGGTIDPVNANQILSWLVSIFVMLVVIVPLTLLLSKSGRSVSTGRKSHSADDER